MESNVTVSYRIFDNVIHSRAIKCQRSIALGVIGVIGVLAQPSAMVTRRGTEPLQKWRLVEARCAAGLNARSIHATSSLLHARRRHPRIVALVIGILGPFAQNLAMAANTTGIEKFRFMRVTMESHALAPCSKLGHAM
jgi:hypothetical protein